MLTSPCRYTLNIKGIPYKTVWVEYPEVEALCKKIGAPPTGKKPDGAPLYTLPTIFDPNTSKAVSDSALIVRYLDATYPAAGPTLVPPALDALLAAFQDAFMGAAFGTGHLPAVMLPAACGALKPPSYAYFKATREAMLGPLDELAPAGSEKRTTHWAGVAKTFGEVIGAGWMGKGPDGKERLFFMGGDTLCYADVTIAGFLKCIQKLTTPEEWTNVMSWDNGRWARFMEAFKPYEAEDAGSVVEL